MPGLEQSVAAWVKRIGNEEGKMLERVRREIARGQASRLNHLATLSDNLLPSGTLQERIWTHFDLAECAGTMPLVNTSRPSRASKIGMKPVGGNFAEPIAVALLLQ